MGHMQAAAFGEAVATGEIQRRAALEWHVTANHFPPLPIEYVDVAVEVIDRLDGAYAEDVDWDELVLLPKGLRMLPREVQWLEVAPDEDSDTEERAGATLGTLVEILHLDGFINWEGE